MNKKEIIEGLKDLQMHSGNIVFSQAIQALENKPSIKEIEDLLEKKFNHLFSPEENYLGRFLLAKAIYNFRRER